MDERPNSNPQPEEATSGAGKPVKLHDWKLIALVAVSILSLLLLASTIALAVTGDFGCHRDGARRGRPGTSNRGPLRGQRNRIHPNPRFTPPVNPEERLPKDQQPQDRLPESEKPQPQPQQ